VANQRKIDYNLTFNSDHGRKVLNEIMAYCHVLEPLPTTDPNQILIREGRRDVANMILSAMKYTPADYPDLIDKAANPDG
jgi:hypothetical protein